MVVNTTSTGITLQNVVTMWSEFNFLDESVDFIMEKLEGQDLHLTQIFNGLRDAGFPDSELEEAMFPILEAMWTEINICAFKFHSEESEIYECEEEINISSPAFYSEESDNTYGEPKRIPMNYFSDKIVIFYPKNNMFVAEMHELANLLLNNGVKAIIIEQEEKQSSSFFLSPDIAGDGFLEESEFYKEKNLFYLKKEIPAEILADALKGIIEFE